MKKIFIFAAIALVAGVSCTKQVPADNNSPDVPISFSPISQRTGTKAEYKGEQNATYTGNGSPSTYENFTAWSYFTKEASATTNPLTNSEAAAGSAFFTAQKTVYDNTYDVWKLENAAYWPKAGYLHFHAFSPNDFSPAAGSLTHNWNGGFVLTDYVAPVYVDADADGLTESNQVDVLYSDFVFDKQRSNYNPQTGLPYDDEDNSGANPVHQGVNIAFNHALAAVQFKIKTAANYKTGTHQHVFLVKKIEVLNALNKGTFTENRATTLDNAFKDATGTVITKNQDNALTTTPYWTPSDEAANEKSYTVYAATTGTEALNTLSDQIGTTILPVPQPLAHATTNKVQVKVTFDYKFSTDGGSTWYEYTGQTATTNLTGSKGTYAGGAEGAYQVDNWLINHKYVYVLNFKLDELIFDPKVEAFVLVDNIGVDLPYQN